MHRGYVKLFRSIKDSGIIEDGPMCQVFIKALTDAAFANTRMRAGRQFVDLHPGEFIFGRNRWAKELNLSPKVVRNRIANLEKRDTLKATHHGNEYTVFKFVNWESYAGYTEEARAAEGAPTPAPKGQPEANQGPHKKNLKKLRLVEDKNSPPIPQGGSGYTQAFEAFWEECPKKVGKKDAFKSWKKIRGVNAAIIVNAIKEQVKVDHFKGNDGKQYFPNPATWLNQGRWEDEINADSDYHRLPPELRPGYKASPST
ncbi:Lrp/AsnC family transcriptional regulator [Pseudodesulfovibrio indicus]|uniref:Lrp/AsnC family transcriptional regulator n=1 Tax=Pseudodesulfovibrio indicus TaxID=1716143 RepID=UPI00292EA57C|nr:Lrp/AsnC family transcriptional regulator [Pseudodesulfovibrio indicus]